MWSMGQVQNRASFEGLEHWVVCWWGSWQERKLQPDWWPLQLQIQFAGTFLFLANFWEPAKGNRYEWLTKASFEIRGKKNWGTFFVDIRKWYWILNTITTACFVCSNLSIVTSLSLPSPWGSPSQLSSQYRLVLRTAAQSLRHLWRTASRHHAPRRYRAYGRLLSSMLEIECVAVSWMQWWDGCDEYG